MSGSQNKNIMEKIVLIGCGGHARSVADCIEQNGLYQIAGFVDKQDAQEIMNGYPIIGTDDDLGYLYKQGITKAFITVGYMGKGEVRPNLYKYVKEIGYELPSIIDPSAILALDCKIQEGTFVGKRAVVNANARIGKMCILNSGAIIEHDCVVGDYSHIAVGSVLCGEVSVGESVFVGANATVIQGLQIEDYAIVGAGTTVRHSLVKGEVYYGKENT